MRGILSVLLLVLPALPLAVQARIPLQQVDEWTRDYDAHFRKYSKRYFGPHIDWRWFKSQGIAESGLDPDAASKAGARGVMQIMPATYTEIRKQNPHFPEVNVPRWNIAAGIYYDRQLYDKWRSPPPGEERLYFAFGSYNAGYGRIALASRKAQENPGSWHAVRPYVPSQTRHYVRRIRRLMTEPQVSLTSLEQ
ncbi:MAG TPA: transglycosylase SLT domain-containing protein [Gammaproteobacteria bacterium]|nr:transglycosylase SLT domain-containing protein [Gammaproteobacteria bacterium]